MMIRNTEFVLLHMDVVFAAEMTDATSYLKYLVETYPERVANTQENQSAGDWIFQNLLDMRASVTREPVIGLMSILWTQKVESLCCSP